MPHIVSNNKKKKQGNPLKKLWIAVGGLVLLGLCVALAVSNIRLYHTRQALHYQINSLKAKAQELKNSNAHLEQGIQNASDEQYIEKVAREELDLQMPGEKVVSFVTNSVVEAQAEPVSTNVVEYWVGWVGGLFKK